MTFDIPQHETPPSWDRRKIKFHLSGFFGGGTPSKDNLDYWTDGTVPWVTPKDMKRRIIDTAEDLITVDAVKNSATNMVPPSSVLMVVRSGILKHSLPVALNTVPVALNQDMKAFRFRRSLLPEFFAYWIEGQQKHKLLEWCQIGATVDNINVDAMLNGQIAAPDLATQRQIADFLDRETARIDLLIEKKQRLVALLGERVTSLITQVTKQGLKDEDHVDTGIDWWSRAPSSWEVHRIASLFRESKEMGEEGLPVLSVSINWGISDRELADEDRDRIVNLIEDKTSYKRVRPGDLVYNMMRAWQGAFGVAKVDGLVSPAYVVARPRKGLHSAYFEHLLRTPSCVEEFRRASKGIADFRQRLYWEHFRQVQLVLPTYDEQVEIAAYIERERAQTAPTVSKTQESIDRLKEYRSALITAAVTGQIDVTTYAKSGTPNRRLDAIQEEMGA